MLKKYHILLICVFVIAVGGIFFFFRLYQHDMGALTDFVVSYTAYDTAVSDYSIRQMGDTESRADIALNKLTAKSAFTLSSLIKHEREAMTRAREVADLSRRELDSLKAYKQALRDAGPDADTLAKEYSGLSGNRKAAYAAFQALGR